MRYRYKMAGQILTMRYLKVMKDKIDGFQVTLKDLQDESVYELRVAGKNSMGKGVYTQSKATTAMDKPG